MNKVDLSPMRSEMPIHSPILLPIHSHSTIGMHYIPMHFNCKSIRTYFQKKAQSGDLRPQLTNTSGDWFKQTTAAAVEKRQERRVEIEQSWERGEGGGIVLASCHSFSFAIEIKRKRKKEVR
ncbi:Uncharacterized protein Rs2_48273 [Raphanus sativus]|nr:Uncharacterized protein Rs2_48273 [Raphanus sativus]